MPMSELDERALFGMTRRDALSTGVCMECKRAALPMCTTDEGRANYALLGICELCVSVLLMED